MMTEQAEWAGCQLSPRRGNGSGADAQWRRVIKWYLH